MFSSLSKIASDYESKDQLDMAAPLSLVVVQIIFFPMCHMNSEIVETFYASYTDQLAD